MKISQHFVLPPIIKHQRNTIDSYNRSGAIVLGLKDKYLHCQEITYSAEQVTLPVNALVMAVTCRRGLLAIFYRISQFVTFVNRIIGISCGQWIVNKCPELMPENLFHWIREEGSTGIVCSSAPVSRDIILEKI